MILELFFVEVAVVQQVWALKDSHLAAGDGMERWCCVLVWDSLEEGVDHLLRVKILIPFGCSIYIHWFDIGRILRNLARLRHFELQNSNKCDLFVESESIGVLIVELNDAWILRWLWRLLLIFWSTAFHDVQNPLIDTRYWDAQDVSSFLHKRFRASESRMKIWSTLILLHICRWQLGEVLIDHSVIRSLFLRSDCGLPRWLFLTRAARILITASNRWQRLILASLSLLGRSLGVQEADEILLFVLVLYHTVELHQFVMQRSHLLRCLALIESRKLWILKVQRSFNSQFSLKNGLEVCLLLLSRLMALLWETLRILNSSLTTQKCRYLLKSNIIGKVS